MDKSTSDNPRDCRIANADSTTTMTTTTTTTPDIVAHNTRLQTAQQQQQQLHDTHQQQQVSSTTTNNANNNNNNNVTAGTSTTTTTNNKSKSPTPPPNKLKAQQQQQLQHHQFRAPQQFVKHKKSASTTAGVNSASSSNNNSSLKKNKTWSKRNHKLSKQNVANFIASGQFSTVGGGNILSNNGNSNKADLENIQNIKNQIGGGGHHHRSGINTAGINLTQGGNNGANSSAVGLPNTLDKLGYGHGHGGLKAQQYKKTLPHRGHHHHVLCAGAAHNSLGNNGGVGVGGHHNTCCLLNGCNGAAGVVGGSGVVGAGASNGKDTSSISGNSVNSSGGVNSVHYCCGRSKFFLPEKRIRKEVFVPPTKFLLGGNISDPLNLNSLQNETSNASSNNNTPATTPRQSPITTPPKVEVIIPPNIHDPLHLLDPVDSMEYEKQLTSPMKRGLPRGGNGGHLVHLVPPHHVGVGGGGGGGGNKHRHRKNRKPKRRRHDSSTTTHSTSTGDEATMLAHSTMMTDDGDASNTNAELLISIPSGGEQAEQFSIDTVNGNETTASIEQQLNVSEIAGAALSVEGVEVGVCVETKERLRSPTKHKLSHETHALASSSAAAAIATTLTAEHLEQNVELINDMTQQQQQQQQHVMRGNGTDDLLLTTSLVTSASEVAGLEGNSSAAAAVATAAVVGSRAHVSRDLRLDLSGITANTCYGLTTAQAAIGAGVSSVGSAANNACAGRKRKISESNNSQKSKKFHRHDGMDKIVSPVVPQPGAWKRPPRLQPTGARKSNNRRSTSFSETELPSPVDELNKPAPFIDVEIPRDDTPDFSKLDTTSETGLGSPLSTISAATSLTAGEQDSLADISANNSDANIGESLKTAAANQPAVSEVATISKMPKFRADGAKYRYGNFDRYADFRQLNEFRDVRLQVFQRHLELFQNKDILDIGCNVGHMTISVARTLAPKSILGIDIDRQLVTRARRNLSIFVRIPAQVLAESKTKKNTVATAATTTAAAAAVGKGTEGEQAEGVENETDVDGKKKHRKTRRKKRKRKCNALSLAPQTAATQLMQQQQHQHLHHHHAPLQHHHHHHHHHHHLQHLQQLHMLHHHHHHHYHNLREQQQQKKLQELHVPAEEFFPISFPLIYGGIPSTAQLAAGDKSPVLAQAAATESAEVGDAETGAGTGTGTGTEAETETAQNVTNNKSTTNDVVTPTTAANRRKNKFPENVYFRNMNYVLKDEALLSNDTQQYDLILCLSVTKWIHLNFGDAGLKLAFKRMFNQLRPGGKLILEAQNWASYKKKKNLTPEIYKNYKEIEFFPNKFHEYLLSSEVGFSHSYTLGVPRHLNKGFCRPIQLYAKGDYTPNHVRWSDAYYPQTPYEAYRGIYATMAPRALGSASGHNAGGSSGGGFGSSGMPFNMSSTRSQPYDTPHYTGSASGSYSCRQTPMHQPTSQYYNPLETDSYLPSYDMEYLNHMYVFASPLYQTVWSPPASLRKSSSHTPVFGSVRDAELDGDGSASGGGSSGGSYHRHVYPPNDDTCSPNANAGNAFNSIRDPDTDDSGGSRRHVYATNCGESSSSPQVNHHADAETIEALIMEDEQQQQQQVVTSAGVGAGGGTPTMNGVGNYCDLNDA